MKKKFRKALIFITVLLVMGGAIPFSGFAETTVQESKISQIQQVQKEQGSLRIIVNNEAWSVSEGAPWEGQWIDESVDFDLQDNLLTLLKKALKLRDKSTNGLDESKIPVNVSSVSGIDNDFAQGSYKWVCYINNKNINEEFDKYSVAVGNIKEKDEIRFEYESVKADENSDCASGDSSDTGEAGQDTGDVTGGDNEEQILDAALTASLDADAQAGVEEERLSDEILLSRLSTADIIRLAGASSREEKAAYKDTGKYIGSQGVPGATEKSKAIGLARADSMSSTAALGYYFEVENYVRSNGGVITDAAENAGMILGLTSVGRPVTSVGGSNLLGSLGDFDYVTSQGVYSAAWSLTAIDSRNYDIPKIFDRAKQVTRDRLIEYILDSQVIDGQWTSYAASNVETTALAIQALSPYYYRNEDVEAAVEKGLDYLSEQITSGSFYDGTGTDAVGLSQVIITLTGLGKNLNSNSAYIFQGNTLIDNLMNYYKGNGTFKNTVDGGSSDMATEAAYNALVAHNRFLSGKSSLYYMLDVVTVADKEAAAAVVKLIDAIDRNITRNSGPTINKARKAYDSLSYAAKKLVTNLDKLIYAEVEFTAIKKATASKRSKATAMSGVAKKANSLINSIFDPKNESLKLPEKVSKLTKEQLRAILTAYEEYNKLSDTQKKKVSKHEEFDKLLKELEAIMHTDKKTGIILDGIEWKYKLIVKKQDYEGRDIRKIERTAGSNAEVLRSYNIYIKDLSTGKKYVPNEPVTLKMPKVELKKHKMPIIAHEYADNKYEFIQCKADQKYFVFEAQTFSPFSIIGFDGTWAEVAAGDLSSVGLWILVGIFIVFLVSLVIFSLKMKKANSMERYIKRHVSP